MTSRSQFRRYPRLLRSMQAAAEEEAARAIAAGWRASQHELLARRRAQRLVRRDAGRRVTRLAVRPLHTGN